MGSPSNMVQIRLRSNETFQSLTLALQTLPDCQDESLGGEGKSHLWIWNALHPAYLHQNPTSSVPPSSGEDVKVVYNGVLNIGRKPIFDLVLKDRAISLQHAQVKWSVVINKCPTTETPARWGGSDHITHLDPVYNPGDIIQVQMTLTDSSTNGTYEGAKRILRNTPSPVVPKIVGQAPSQVFSLAPGEPSAAPSDLIALGKPFADDSPSICAFGIALFASAPWHRWPVSVTPVQLNFLPFPVDPSNVKMIQPRSPLSLQNEHRRLVKLERGAGVGEDGPPQRQSLPLELTSGQLRKDPPALVSPLAAENTELIQELKDRINELDSLVRRKESDLGIKDKEVHGLRLQVEECRKEESALRRKIAEVESLRAEEVRRSSKKVRDGDDRISELENELGVVNKKFRLSQAQYLQSVKEKEEASSEISRLTDALDRSEAKKRQLTSQIDDYESRGVQRVGELTRMTAELAQLRSESVARGEEMMRLQEALTAAQAKVREADQLQTSQLRDLRDLTARISQIQQSRDSLADEAEILKKIVTSQDESLRIVSDHGQNWITEQEKMLQTLSVLLKNATNVSATATQQITDWATGDESWGQNIGTDNEEDVKTDEDPMESVPQPKPKNGASEPTTMPKSSSPPPNAASSPATSDRSNTPAASSALSATPAQSADAGPSPHPRHSERQPKRGILSSSSPIVGSEDSKRRRSETPARSGGSFSSKSLFSPSSEEEE